MQSSWLLTRPTVLDTVGAGTPDDPGLGVMAQDVPADPAQPGALADAAQLAKKRRDIGDVIEHKTTQDAIERYQHLRLGPVFAAS